MADDEIPAPGADPDSRRRELKMRMAAAETRGDTDTVAELRAALDALNTPAAEVQTGKPEGISGKRDRAQAAASRRDAADKSTKDDADATTTPPAGRSPAPKDTTAAAIDAGTKK